MRVRLAFSVEIHANRGILPIDDVLALGDASLLTIIFVSHATALVKSCSDGVLLLEHGIMTFVGTPEETVKRYKTEHKS